MVIKFEISTVMDCALLMNSKKESLDPEKSFNLIVKAIFLTKWQTSFILIVQNSFRNLTLKLER